MPRAPEPLQAVLVVRTELALVLALDSALALYPDFGKRALASREVDHEVDAVVVVACIAFEFAADSRVEEDGWRWTGATEILLYACVALLGAHIAEQRTGMMAVVDCVVPPGVVAIVVVT